jgi:predicted amidohydrolase
LTFTIALGQVTTSEKKSANLKKGIQFIRTAAEKGADLVILPELLMAYRELSDSQEKFYETAETLSGPFVSTMASEAKARKIHVAFGMFERSEKGRLVHNTVVMVGPDGALLGSHRKVQLFDSFGYRESGRIAPGEELEDVFETRLGRIGMISCYELRFPELSRILTLRGADLLVVPTAWVAGRLKEDHLRVLTRARALENTVFVAVACQTGRIFTGRSTVVDPFGIPICDAGEEEGLILAEIDLQRIKRVRKILPSLQHLRHDIYAEFWRKHKRLGHSQS